MNSTLKHNSNFDFKESEGFIASILKSQTKMRNLINTLLSDYTRREILDIFVA